MATTQLNTLDGPAQRAAVGDMTAAAIFASRGQLLIFAELAKAAYHLHSQESDDNNINELSPNAVDAYNAVTSLIRPLDTTDLPGLDAVPDPDNDFAVKGLVDGIYTSSNAAVFVGRSSDALFISFRGTNDDAPRLPPTPDQDHWTDIDGGGPDEGKQDHYDLLADLIAAIDAYVAAGNGIDKVYVTGHSLGASMAQAFMDDHLGNLYQAITFASPGFGSGADGSDPRITNFWHDNDPIRIAAGNASTDGDKNFFDGSLANSLLDFDAHAMDLYLEFVRLLAAEGLDIDDINGGFNGIDYDHIIADANVIDAELGLFTVGERNDRLVGSSDHEIMLGGARHDSLFGNAGVDLLFAGDGNDFASGGTGGDSLFGGRGADDLRGNGGNDELFGQQGDDQLLGGAGADHLSGSGGNDSVRGGGGNDVLLGGNGRDNLRGNGGADVLKGGNDNDNLNGGAGNDRIDGQGGNDKLRGLAGNDIFEFSTGGGKDRIRDFVDGEDQIDLSEFNFTDVAAAKSFASDVAGDVVFDFGGGDVLTVDGITKSALTGADLIL